MPVNFSMYYLHKLIKKCEIFNMQIVSPISYIKDVRVIFLSKL